VRFQALGATRPLPASMEAGLYRIAQEAITNVVQHAQASRAKMSLRITPAAVTFTLTDNGRGFDPASVPYGRFGLTGLNERAKLLGGKLHIHSTPGKGTEVEVQVRIGEA
jgi:signal transduction histidine kinase